MHVGDLLMCFSLGDDTASMRCLIANRTSKTRRKNGGDDVQAKIAKLYKVGTSHKRIKKGDNAENVRIDL